MNIQKEYKYSQQKDYLKLSCSSKLVQSSYNSSNSVQIFKNESNVMIINSSSVITTQNSNYQRTEQQLLGIDNTDCEEYEDEWGATRPTPYAWRVSLEILQKLGKLMTEDFPLGFASLESDGGIEIIWKNYNTKNEVRLLIPSCNDIDMSIYIRHYGYEGSKILSCPSINQLVRVLRFLYQ
jgi:hypothetical protein